MCLSNLVKPGFKKRYTIRFPGKGRSMAVGLFLVPVTLTFHQFWTIAEPMARQMELAAFLKNLSLLGGAVIITRFGAGEFSLDRFLERRKFPGSTPAAA